MRPIVTVLLLAALVAAAVPPGTAAERPGPTGMGGALVERLLVTNAVANPLHPFMAFDTHQMNLHDLDGDGRMELISQNDNLRLYVLDVLDGRVLADLETMHWPGWAARDINGVAVGDVNANGKPDLVSVNSMGVVTVYEFAGRNPDGTFAFTKLWQRTPNPTELDANYTKRFPKADPWPGQPSADGAPYLAKAPGGGTIILLQTDGMPGQYALTGNNTYAWYNLSYDGNGGPIAQDLDGDGRVEAVFATDGGDVMAYDVATGDLRWSFSSKAHGSRPASIPVAPAVLDLKGDGTRVVVFAARQAVKGGAPDWHTKQHQTIYALKPDGSLLWKSSFPEANPLNYMQAAPFDANGDGTLDVIMIDWNTIGHNPGNWETTGRPSNLFALDGRNGKLLWRVGVDATWSNKNVAIADVNGDGAQEIVVEAQKFALDGLALHDPKTGEEKGWIPFPPGGWKASRGPIVADIAGDGYAQVVIPLMRGAEGCAGPKLDVGCREGAIMVYDTNVALDAAYSNNERFNHALDGPLFSGAGEKKTPAKAPVGTLIVRVVNATGAPIAGAKVVAKTPNGTMEATSDANGTARFAAKAGRATIEASREGFGAGGVEGAIVRDRETPIAVTLEERPQESVGGIPIPGPAAGLFIAIAAALAILRRKSR
ncbi:MAG TPA: FG-GAP-like repeat-containing protein [Candidatus Thermoplasmatota archaeon]|nr:FG-GAP-like repeat-containing protein [Candidatus Thermoplasmatota archaeon]